MKHLSVATQHTTSESNFSVRVKTQKHLALVLTACVCCPLIPTHYLTYDTNYTYTYDCMCVHTLILYNVIFSNKKINCLLKVGVAGEHTQLIWQQFINTIHGMCMLYQGNTHPHTSSRFQLRLDSTPYSIGLIWCLVYHQHIISLAPKIIFFSAVFRVRRRSNN